MAWLATDKNGKETISPGRPEFDGFEWCYTEENSIESEYGNIEYLLTGTMKQQDFKNIVKKLIFYK